MKEEVSTIVELHCRLLIADFVDSGGTHTTGGRQCKASKKDWKRAGAEHRKHLE